VGLHVPNPTEFRYGLKWIMGIKLLENPIACSACATMHDSYGRHAVTYCRSGAITRCHNLLRDVVKAKATTAGCKVLPEQTIPSNHALRPEDLLIQEGRQTLSPGLYSVYTINASESNPELRIANESSTLSQSV